MKAMILAAGRGERMRPLTDTTPKPLLRAGGKPLIEWHIERLANAGLRHIVINHAWLGEQIKNTLGNGQKWGVSIQYSAEPQALETAGGIAQALPLLGPKPFLVINGDIWCDWNPAQALAAAQQLQQQNKLAWLMLVNNPPHHPKGDFAPQALQLEPAAHKGLLTFSGIGIYQPRLFAALKAGIPAPLAPLLRTAIENHQALGHHYTGRWLDIGTPERLQALNQQLGRPATTWH